MTLQYFSDETVNFRTPAEPREGEPFTVRFRVLKGTETTVSLHISRDGEASVSEMRPAYARGVYVFYEAQAEGVREKAEYYFTTASDDGTVWYYGKNGLSQKAAEVQPFRVLPQFSVPDWARGAVWYQIFPDRFANGDPSNDPTEGEYTDATGEPCRFKAWDEPVGKGDFNTFYGGDLKGIIDHLDYLKGLGVDVLYLNPIFVSPSSHKYNTQDYEHVDPHLGVIVKDAEEPDRYGVRTTSPENLEASDALLAKLIEEAHARKMRVVLDGVFNHCGDFHKWMDRYGIYKKYAGHVGAWWDSDCESAQYFRYLGYHEYECWWNNETLPKLNLDGSEKLREEIFRIAEKWVSPPYNADGWRLDVAADACHSPEANHAFWKEFRQRVRAARPDAIILAEHYGDPASWLGCGEWDSVMNYDAFMDPVSAFLTGVDKHSDWYTPEEEGAGALFWERYQRASSRLPQASLETALNELDNHDHSRFLSRTNHVVGRLGDRESFDAEKGTSKALLRAGVVMQMTLPGAPGIYYGDEAGLCGFTDPDNRRPFPWGREDTVLQDFYLNAVRLHKNIPALKGGSLVPVIMDSELVVFGRCKGDDAALVVIYTGTEGAHVRIDLSDVTGIAPTAVSRVLHSSDLACSLGRKNISTPMGTMELSLLPRTAEIYVW